MMMTYRLENEISVNNGNNAFAVASNPPLSDLTQYINPNVKNGRIQNAIDNHGQGFQHKPSKPEAYKTVMCQAWLESMKCTFGENCKFAHGEQDLRPAKIPIRHHPKYKTKACEKYTKSGICPYGSRCLFIHPEAPTQEKPQTTVASIGSQNSSPVSVSSSLDDLLQSIWAPNPNIMNAQVPRQQQFSKSGPERIPIRGAIVENPWHGAQASDIIESSLMFNQTAEAMVSFLWA